MRINTDSDLTGLSDHIWIRPEVSQAFLVEINLHSWSSEMISGGFDPIVNKGCGRSDGDRKSNYLGSWENIPSNVPWGSLDFICNICVWEMTHEPSGRTQLLWTVPESRYQYHAKLLPVPGERANDNLWDYFLQICALMMSLRYCKDEGNTVLSQHYFVTAWFLLGLPPPTVTFTVLMLLGLSTTLTTIQMYCVWKIRTSFVNNEDVTRQP